MTEHYTIKKACLKGQRILQPGERHAMRAIGGLSLSVCALVVATVAAAIYKAVR